MEWTRLLSIILAVCTLHSVYGQNEPEITQAILPDIKRVGETGRLNCTITRQGKNKVFWIYAASQLIITSDDKVDLEEQLNPLLDNGSPKFDVEKHVYGVWVTYMLIVRRLELTDAGMYTCSVLIRGQENSPSKSGYIIVQSPPTIELLKTTQVVSIDEYGSVNLTCSATGFPTPKISWVRPNGNPIPGSIYNTYMGRDLQIKNATKNDRGVYRCIADNDVRPPANFDVTLYVQFKPFARPVQDSYGQAQNRLFDVVIECRVAGFPEPNLQWYQKVGQGLVKIGDNDEHVIHVLISYDQQVSGVFWFQLRILNVQANDYGIYVCEGSNKLGKHQAYITLYETSECQGPNCPAQGSYLAAATNVAVSLSVLLTSLLFACFHLR